MRTSVEFSPSYAMLNVELDSGESIKAETGAMVAQQGVSMSTGTGGGGFLGGISRMVSGESFSLNTFTAERNGGCSRLRRFTPCPPDHRNDPLARWRRTCRDRHRAARRKLVDCL